MSITVCLWSESDLKKVKSGEDKHLSTIFMNVKTFSRDEISNYPYHLRKEYNVCFNDGNIVKVYATDDESLLWFLEQEYHTEAICQIDEVITSYREVDYADYFANLKNMTK